MIKKNINSSLIFHVIKFSETLRKYGDNLTRDYGLTTQQWFILLLLAKDPNIIYLQENPQDKPLLAKELAEAMNVSRANITNLLNVLLKKKLIKQSFDNKDKRRKRLVLTREGQKVIMALEPIREKRNKKLVEPFSKQEKETFIAFIQVALQTLKTDMGQSVISGHK